MSWQNMATGKHLRLKPLKRRRRKRRKGDTMTPTPPEGGRLHLDATDEPKGKVRVALPPFLMSLDVKQSRLNSMLTALMRRG